MKIWTIYDTTEAILPGFDPKWLPPLAKGVLEVFTHRSKGGAVLPGLSAGPYVGVVALTNGDTLRIAPRAGERTFWRMLLFSEQLLREVETHFAQLASVPFDHTGESSWFELLAKGFVSQLRTIEKNSLRVNRVAARERTNGARGRLLVVPSILSVSRRESVPLHCVVRERTYDTPENRVLGTASRRLLDSGLAGEDGRRTLARWSRFAINTSLAERDLVDVVSGLKMNRFVGPRSYYIPALVMARLLLADAGVSFSGADAVLAESFLTNVRTVFEGYVRAVVFQSLKNDGFVVEKPGASALGLFEDGSSTLVPDVAISDGSGIRLIVDAKYKLDYKGSEADYYQVFAYLSRYQCRKAVITYPGTGTGDQIRRRSLFNKHEIYELGVPLNDPVATEDCLRAVTRKLLGLA